MNKKTEITTFISMLEKSKEYFRIAIEGVETNVKLKEQGIIFIFDVKGKFLRITKIK